VSLAERRKTLLVDHVDVLREATKKAKQKHAFHIDAIADDAWSSTYDLDITAK